MASVIECQDDDLHMGGGNSEQDAVAEVAYLARSLNRVRLLAAIREAGEIERQPLKDEFEMARTTLVRNLESLEARGWITTDPPSTYALTAAGELVADAFADLTRVIQLTKRLDPVLRSLPAEPLELDPCLLADADVVVSTETDPFAPVHRHVEALKHSESARLCLAVVGQQALEEMGRRIQTGDVTVESVVERGVTETIQSNARYADLLGEQLETGRHDVFVYEGSIPFYLGILDDTVQIGVEDAAGIPHALLETESPAVHDWAIDTYTTFREKAAPLTELDHDATT